MEAVRRFFSPLPIGGNQTPSDSYVAEKWLALLSPPAPTPEYRFDKMPANSHLAPKPVPDLAALFRDVEAALARLREAIDRMAP